MCAKLADDVKANLILCIGGLGQTSIKTQYIIMSVYTYMSSLVAAYSNQPYSLWSVLEKQLLVKTDP